MILYRSLTRAGCILIAVISAALLNSLDLSFTHWRLFIVAGLSSTAVMLYHKTLRHFVLFPSCLVFSSGLLLIIMHYR